MGIFNKFISVFTLSKNTSKKNTQTSEVISEEVHSNIQNVVEVSEGLLYKTFTISEEVKNEVYNAVLSIKQNGMNDIAEFLENSEQGTSPDGMFIRNEQELHGYIQKWTIDIHNQFFINEIAKNLGENLDEYVTVDQKYKKIFRINPVVLGTWNNQKLIYPLKVVGEGGFGVCSVAVMCDPKKSDEEKYSTVVMKERKVQELQSFSEEENKEQALLIKCMNKAFFYEKRVCEKMQDLHKRLGSDYPRTLISPVVIDEDVIAYNPYQVNGKFLSLKKYIHGLEDSKIAQTIASLMQDITEALLFLHSNNLVHLDTKIENVCLWQDGDKVRAGLIDIGTVSSIHKYEHQSYGLVANGFPSSRLIRNDFILDEMNIQKVADPRSDMYALFASLNILSSDVKRQTKQSVNLEKELSAVFELLKKYDGKQLPKLSEENGSELQIKVIEDLRLILGIFERVANSLEINIRR